jgi:hypothetical protein
MSSGKGKALLHRQNDRRETGLHGGDVATGVIRRMPATGSASTDGSLDRQFRPQHSPFIQSRTQAYEMGLVPSTPLPLTNPVATTKEAIRSKKIRLNHLVDGPDTAHTVTSQGAMISGRGKALLHRQSDRRETGLHGGDVVTGVIGRMPATGSASTITPFVRQFHRKDTGSHRAGYDTKMVTRQGWVLPIVGPTYEGGSTLRRQLYNRDTALRRLYSRGETPLHLFDDPTKEVTGHLSATRRVSPIGEMEARTPAGMISLPALASNIVQRRVVIRGRRNGKSDPSSYIEKPRIALPRVGGERSKPTEANSETGIVYRRLLLSQASANLNWFDKGHSLFRRTVGNLADPLAVATRGETRADVADHRLSKSSALRVIQPREAVHPVRIQRMAAREDSWSGLRAVSPFSTLTKAWPVTPASPPLLRRSNSWTDRGEEASIAMIRDAAHDMPLAPRLKTESRGSSISNHRISGTVVQTSPQSPLPATAAAAPIGGGEESEALETETGAPRAQIDPDELVEKAWQKLMNKLTIELERRGCTKWLWKN